MVISESLFRKTHRPDRSLNTGDRARENGNFASFWHNPQVALPVLLALWRQSRGDQLPAGLQLTLDWYLEQGDEVRVFGPEYEVTRFLQRDRGVCQAREQFIRSGRRDMVDRDAFPYAFDRHFLSELAAALLQDQWSGSFLGGYRVEIREIEPIEKRVEITVTNRTGWASACRLSFSSRSLRADEAREVPGPGGTMVQYYRWQEVLD